MGKTWLIIAVALAALGLAFTAMPGYSTADPANPAEPSYGLIESSGFKFNLDVIEHEKIREQNWINQGANYILERIVTIIATTVASAAVLVVTVGGFRILASRGEPTELEKGKKMIYRALIGLLVTLGAYLMIRAVQLLVASIF